MGKRRTRGEYTYSELATRGDAPPRPTEDYCRLVLKEIEPEDYLRRPPLTESDRAWATVMQEWTRESRRRELRHQWRRRVQLFFTGRSR